ncbi:UNVERIFIED_CONTAM: hypothetical protein Sindi_1261600 [Sesamum indicum]
MSIYYVSKVLNGTEERHTPIEKMALALLVKGRTNSLVKQASGEPDTLGRLVKWAALADFVSEIIGMPLEEAPEKKVWLLHVDGSARTQGSGASTVNMSPQGEDIEFAIRFEFKASNNEVEYKTLVVGMRKTHEVGARHLVAYSD